MIVVRVWFDCFVWWPSTVFHIHILWPATLLILSLTFPILKSYYFCILSKTFHYKCAFCFLFCLKFQTRFSCFIDYSSVGDGLSYPHEEGHQIQLHQGNSSSTNRTSNRPANGQTPHHDSNAFPQSVHIQMSPNQGHESSPINAVS